MTLEKRKGLWKEMNRWRKMDYILLNASEYFYVIGEVSRL